MDGAGPTRQRLAAVMEVAACARCFAGRRSTRAVQPVFSAASCRRRLAVRSSRSTSPTTADSTPARKPSSMAASRSLSSRVAATMRRRAGSPTAARPGPYSSCPRAHHSTAEPRRPAREAANPMTAAKLPRLGPAPAISWSAPRGRPPSGHKESSASIPNGSAACPALARKPSARSRPRRVSFRCRRAADVLPGSIKCASRCFHGFAYLF